MNVAERLAVRRAAEAMHFQDKGEKIRRAEALTLALAQKLDDPHIAPIPPQRPLSLSECTRRVHLSLARMARKRWEGHDVTPLSRQTRRWLARKPHRALQVIAA